MTKVSPEKEEEEKKKREQKEKEEDKLLEFYFSSKDARTLENLGGKKSLLRHVMKIPVINLVYDLLLDSAPEFDQVVALCNLMGLIGALMLTMAVSIPTSVEYDEIEAHVNRVKYNNNEFQKRFNDSAHHIMDKLIVNVITSVVLNTFVLLSSLVVYMFASNSDFGDSEKNLFHDDRKNIMMARWWYWVKWTMTLAIIALLGATASFYTSLYYLIVIKFPDYFARKHGYDNSRATTNSPYNFTNLTQWMVLTATIITSLLPLSFGLLRKFNASTKIFDVINIGTYKKAGELIFFLKKIFKDEQDQVLDYFIDITEVDEKKIKSASKYSKLNVPEVKQRILEKSSEQTQSIDLQDCIFTPLFVQYSRILVTNWILTVNELAQLDKADLVDLGIPLGHALKIIKEVRNKVDDATTPVIAIQGDY